LNYPLIGVTTAVYFDQHGHKRYSGYAPIMKAIGLGGGLPVMLPCELEIETLRRLYERVDGVLLPGGGDVDPARYGAEPHPKTGYVDSVRDDLEFTVARWAVEDDRPLFCICRGHQVLNVALGGTLTQDISSQLQTEEVHWFNQPRTKRTHDVHIEADSRLAQILDTTMVDVNSIHHQAIDQVAESLRVIAKSPDGIVEGVEIPEHRFALSVQWHPEELTDDPMMLRLFQSFVSAACGNGAGES
jgi:putative glutamine amidotransferase